MIEILNEYLDSIYYEGYAEQLATENPQAYEHEMELFMYNYN